MQPVGFDTDFTHSTWPNSYEAIPLDGGRWLEIHLGHLNTSPTSHRHEHDQSEWNENFESLHNNNNDPGICFFSVFFSSRNRKKC